MKARTSNYCNRNQSAISRRERGYVSLLAVFTIAIFMFSMLLFAYQRAINSQSVQADVQAQTDYREKEETILRSIVAITPNRAILAMQDGSFSDTEQDTNPLSFRNIFADALAQSNARQSISDPLRAQLAIPTSFSGNTGDSDLANLALMFQPVQPGAGNAGYVTGGLNRNLGAQFPPALDTPSILAIDDLFPIISTVKTYGARADGQVGLATATYPDFNIIPYPNINFGYSQPGQNFVAKRNWWAFSMNLAESDNALTSLARFRRDFVLSIYEIPSQLPISASSYMAFGQHADGSAWHDVNIVGNVYAGRALMEGSARLPTLATRRGAVLNDASNVGGITRQDFATTPFELDYRETYRSNNAGLFPISLSSESGKAAFVPINRSAAFFDRFAHTAEINTISPTSWNEYSVGALQCAMNLDITECVSSVDPTPTKMKFTYLRGGVKTTLTMDLVDGVVAGLPVGYIYSGVQNSTAFFPSMVDTAYGFGEQFFYKEKVIGSIRFDNATFGDPLVGEPRKKGYYKPVYPFERKLLPSGQTCIAFYAERLSAFLAHLGADGLDVNNSISINVDYINSANLATPSIPCTANDYGVILQECGDLTGFTKGFSLVTNLRLYIGDDLNIVEKPTPPPVGLVPPAAGYFPPCSLFSPEKRYGVNFNPNAVEILTGQIGSVASESADTPVHPLDVIGVSGGAMAASRISMNLSTINHPAELPPIFMMNWLIVLEEKR